MAILLEQVPVGDHQLNGLVEGAVKFVQGQLGVIKDALESRRGRRVEGDHPAVPWMMMHTACRPTKGSKEALLQISIQNCCGIKNAFERQNFGENVL